MVFQGLLQYLNSNNLTLTSDFDLGISDFEVRPTSIDMDGDNEAEWALDIKSSRYGLYEWLVVDVDENGRYIIIPYVQFQWPFFPSNIDANVTYDFTGDGVSELLFTRIEHFGAGLSGVSIGVYGWGKEQLDLLVSPSFNVYYADGTVEYEIADMNNNGLSEIRVFWHWNEGYTCKWEQIDTYEWNGIEFQKSVFGDIPPNTAVCNVARGIKGSANLREPEEQLSTDERIHYLTNGLEELTIENAPFVDYIAFVKLQLGMLYATQGKNEEALNTLGEILELSSEENPFAQMIAEQLQIEPNSPLRLCNLLQKSIELESEKWLSSDITEFITFEVYPAFSQIAPEQICPLDTLIMNQLDLFTLSVKNNPEDYFLQIGLPFIPIHHDDIDNDGFYEWIGYFDLNRSPIIIIDNDESKWTAQTIYKVYSSQSLIDYQIIEKNITADDTTEILLMLELEDVQYLNTNHVLILLGQNENEVEQLDRINYYEEVPVLESITLEDFTANDVLPSAWELLEAEFNIDGNFGLYVHDLTRRSLAQEQPSTTLNEIQILLSYLPKDEPDAELQSLRHHLLFLIGYHFELAGEEETAVTHYLNLIEEAPDSPWSWLAWARLEPVE